MSMLREFFKESPNNVNLPPDLAPDIELYKVFESCLRTAYLLNTRFDPSATMNVISDNQLIEIATSMLNYKGQLKQIRMLQEIDQRLQGIAVAIIDSSVETPVISHRNKAGLLRMREKSVK